jgi:RNA polymerase sigma factor (sigma-70 family)
LFRTCDSWLVGWVKRHRLHREEAQECLQEARLKIVQNLVAFQTDGTLPGLCSWLRAIVRSKATDIIRKKKRYRCQPLSPTAEASLVSIRAGPAEEFAKNYREVILIRLLAKLQQESSRFAFQVFTMRWLEGKSIAVIAVSLHCTQRLVRRHLKKTKRLFGQHAKADPETDLLAGLW